MHINYPTISPVYIERHSPIEGIDFNRHTENDDDLFQYDSINRLRDFFIANGKLYELQKLVERVC